MQTFLSFRLKKTSRPLFLIIICLVLFSIHSNAQAPFITTWQTTSSNETITIPTNPGYSYNYQIDWENDGVFDVGGVTGDITHTYPTAGTHQVAIRGIFPAMYVNNHADARTKIISIDQWGDIQWQTMNYAFRGAINLTYAATDSPDLSNVTDMSYMFYFAQIFDGDLNNWDVSNVTNMSRLFSSAYAFNGDVSSWDVSNVADLSYMFASANAFNGDIGSWDINISNTSMKGMFSGASVFNRNLNGWDVCNVSDMSRMFSGATAFNGNISNWDVSGVTDMSYMFAGTDAFNRNINLWPVGGVTDMSYMFSNADAFNRGLTSWYVGEVTNMESMFFNADIFNGDISTWEVSSVTNMTSMFAHTGAFNGDLNNWNPGSVTDMSFMFNSAAAFNGNINNWDVTAVIDMSYMFYFAYAFTGGDMTNWETDELTDMSYMFNNTISFNGDISTWNVSNVTTMEDMFFNANSFNGDLSDWDVESVENMDDMLDNCGMSVTNYDNLLIGWSQLSLYPQLDFGAAGLNYCNGSSARSSIENNYNWYFTGDALNCTPTCLAPTNPAVEIPNPTTAKFSWDEEPEATAYQVKYRLKGTTAWLTAGSSNPFRTISNLSAKKYYQFKVRAECLAGNWSDFTPIVLFYTSTCDEPTGVASIYLDNNRMRIRWDNDPNEIKAKVRYREVGTSTWYTQNSAEGNNYIYINSLTPNATYQYRVRSNCDGNDWSAYSPSYFHDLSSSARLEQGETAFSETKIYPNPASKVLNIEFETKDAEDISITITNSLGKMIQTINNSYNGGIQKESINISQLAKGYYFISIRSGEKIETQKFLRIE